MDYRVDTRLQRVRVAKPETFSAVILLCNTDDPFICIQIQNGSDVLYHIDEL